MSAKNKIYEPLPDISYTTSTLSDNYLNNGDKYNNYDPNYQNFNPSPNTNGSYKSRWDYNAGLSGSQYKAQTKPIQTYSGSSNTYSDYNNIKKLPDQYSNLRKTFDLRGTNKIREMIDKYDKDQTEKPKFQSGKYDSKYDNYERYGNMYGSKVDAPSSKYRSEQLESKLKKYASSTTYDQLNTQMQNTSKMSEQIKKLKQDRRKRLQAKEKQDNNFMLTSSYSSVTLGSSYKPPINIPTKNYGEYDLDKKYSNQSKQQNDGFKKKKSYEIDSPYTPKYQKKNYTQYTSPQISTADKYKSKDYQTEFSKYSKYQSKNYTTLATVGSGSSYPSKVVTSPTNKKYTQPVQYVEINNFILGKSLGQGKFGVVYQATHKPTGWLYAIKKIPKQMIKSHFMIDQFILQMKLQTYLYHQNILSLYTHFDDKNAIYLVLQYMQDGTLFSHLKKNKTLPQAEVASKIKQIASAVKYLHQNQIAHRDIKPQNIVMSHGICKLCDFGWATICDQRRKTYCGTFDYAPPQILQGVQYDYTVDLWCLGVLTYELLVGKAPFYHISRKETMKKILNVEKTNIQYPENLSRNAISFIDSLIKKDPKQRLSSQMLLQHPFLKNADKLPSKH